MLTRREMLKWGVLGGGATLLAPGRLLRTAAADRGDAPVGPVLTPFVQPLPFPPFAQTVPPFIPNAPERDEVMPFVLARHRGSGPLEQFYELVEERRLVRLHPDLPKTPIWSYRDFTVPEGQFPFGVGPLLKFNYGMPTVVRQHNFIRKAAGDFGVPRTTVHFHGGHTPFRSDGFPTSDVLLPPEFQSPPGVPFGDFKFGDPYDYYYPLLDPGFKRNEDDRPERASTMWYHDHLLDFTRLNVHEGLAGLIMAFDELDTGDETGRLFPDTNLRLPSGAFDIPLVLQDKTIAPDGTIVFDLFNHDGVLGNQYLVNGAIQPFLKVKRRKYRFRILDASNARLFQLFISKENGQTITFDQIATEAGLLVNPDRDVESVLLVPSWRVDIVVDFRKAKQGDVLFLENRLLQVAGRKPAQLGGIRTPLLKFIVEEEVPDPSQVRDVLRPMLPISKERLAAAQRQDFQFDRKGGIWVVNRLPVDINVARPAVPENTGQIWTVRNGGGGWVHPLHIHHEFMRVLTRNGAVPPLNERDGNARKDTILLGPKEVAEIFIIFRDYKGPFVFHCHNLEHEDMAMMARFDVV